MSRKDTFISFALLMGGILLQPCYKTITGEYSWPVAVIGFVLIGLGMACRFYALYRNKQYARLKWQAIRFGVMPGVLLLLVLIGGDK